MTGHRAVAGLAAALGVLLLGGCALIPGGDRDEPDWVYDEESARYYRPDLVSQSTELVEEHFPTLGEVAPVTIADGRFTDPADRAPIPAPDDYWWQAVIELDAEQRDAMIARAEGTAGALTALEPVTPETIGAILIPTLDGEVEDCPGGWVDVQPGLAQSANISAAGDMLELTVVCVDGTQLVTSALDM